MSAEQFGSSLYPRDKKVPVKRKLWRTRRRLCFLLTLVMVGLRLVYLGLQVPGVEPTLLGNDWKVQRIRQSVKDKGGNTVDLFAMIRSGQHEWVKRPDGSRELQFLNSHSLHRFTAEEARKCLRDQHILMVGDSLTRFQVTSLVYLLEHGHYPPRYNAKVRDKHGGDCHYQSPNNETICSASDHPNPTTSVDFSGHPHSDHWRSFHYHMAGGSDGSIFHGRMECDCARWNVQNDQHVENFFYASSKLPTTTTAAPNNNNATQPKHDNRILITYLFEHGWGNNPAPISGLKRFSNCAYQGTCRADNQSTELHRCRQASSQNFLWYHPLGTLLGPSSSNGNNRALLHAVSSIPSVDVALYNRGLWGRLQPPRAQRIMALFRQLASKSCWFRSTTASSATPQSIERRHHEHLTIYNITIKEGCQFWDVGHLMKEWESYMYNVQAPDIEERNTIFADEKHFRPWVYEELNNLWLNLLCDKDGGGGMKHF